MIFAIFIKKLQKLVGIFGRKVYKSVFMSFFGLDLKIVRYFVVGSFHAECIAGFANAGVQYHFLNICIVVVIL